jgi:hypothetical protein
MMNPSLLGDRLGNGGIFFGEWKGEFLHFHLAMIMLGIFLPTNGHTQVEFSFTSTVDAETIIRGQQREEGI